MNYPFKQRQECFRFISLMHCWCKSRLQALCVIPKIKCSCKMSAANTEKWREMPLSTKHKNKASRKTKLQQLLLIFSVLVTEQNIQLADLIMLHLFVTDHRLEGHCVCWTFCSAGVQLPMTVGSVVTVCSLTVSIVLSPQADHTMTSLFSKPGGPQFRSSMTTGIVCVSKRWEGTTAPLMPV